MTAPQLTTALINGAARPEMWRVLVDRLRDLGADPAVADLLRGGPAAHPATSAELARRLARAAAADPRLGSVLRHWTAEVTAATAANNDTATANTLTGAATVHGSVVQAGEVRGDVHIHVPPAAGTPPAPHVRPAPRQLLPAPEHFTGRADALDALDALLPQLGGRPLLTVVSGPAGVGKSSLVTRWLHGLTDRFPDGQLYADLRGHLPDAGPAAPGEILGRFLRALGVKDVPVEPAESAALWRSHTAGLRLAVMLDNALSAAQVRPLLPSSPGSLVVVTSRGRLTALGIDGASFQQLGVLSPADAVELLAGRIGAERVRREPEAAEEVAALCAGLPLAVSVAAARLAARPQQSLSAMAGALGGSGAARLDALSLGGEHAVRLALDASYHQLTPELARGYRRLGLPPVTVLNGPVAAAACAVGPDEGDRLLDDLAEVSLLEDLGPDGTTGLGRYRFHDLVRAHAGQLAVDTEDPADRRATVRRVVDHYLATATAAEALLTPSHRTLRRDYAHPPGHRPSFDGPAAALAWLDTERFHLMAALRTAAEQGWDATAWQLADAMWPLFLRLRPYDLWVEAHETGRAAALRAGDRPGLSRMLTSGGVGLRNAGRSDEAVEWFTEAVRGAREDGDRKAEAQALHGLGQSHLLAGRLDRATAYLTEALALREAIGYRRGAAMTRICLGDAALAAGRPGQALAPFAEARAALVAVADPYDAARALAFLGLALARAGARHTTGEDAETVLRQALDEFVATGSVHWQGRVLEMLGETAALRGDPAAARELYERSLARYAPVSESDATRLRARLAGTDPLP
ncbi:ATP-binding protein [Streptomyces showdoensis]|uniref:ATP-binding protein n=2 Tax=Streptomyces showdoensis TaxID=68268 RepID=UPI001F0B647D|nr:tetratricopeptide repeat protein [Streptomyces showdoensis]